MARYKPRVISLTKRPGHTFGFYLRLEHGEDGHLIRCLDMGGPAELAGMKDGDRVLRVNGAFVDELPHSEVVDIVRDSGASVTFHLLDEASYKEARAQGANLSNPNGTPVANGVAQRAPRPKLCYLAKSSSSYGFSLRSVAGKPGFSLTEVTPGQAAHAAGIRADDRLLEINGENVEHLSETQVVEKINLSKGGMVFLLVDEETQEYYRNKRVAIGSWLATVRYLPYRPSIVDMAKGADGYGFVLLENTKRTGHFVGNIDGGSAAETAGLKETDRLVAVNGEEVEGCSHEQVVNMIKQGGDRCSLLVVDTDTDQMYKQGKVSPMLFCDDAKDSNSPPSYTEALNFPALVRPPTPPPAGEEEAELKPKLCKMEKTSGDYGFHLNGIQGVCGHYIEEVVEGGLADRAGLKDDDVVVEVNGVNVERSSHEEAVALIRSGGDTLEMLTATRSVYGQLAARGVAVTRLLLGERSYAQVHSEASPRPSGDARQKEAAEEEEAGSETSTQAVRGRTSSSSSQDSIDLKL